VRWIRFQAGSQASSTRREETCLSIHPHAKKERKGPGKATRRAQPRRQAACGPWGSTGAGEPLGTRSAPGTWQENRVFTLAYEWSGALQTFRESELVRTTVSEDWGPGTPELHSCCLSVICISLQKAMTWCYSCFLTLATWFQGWYKDASDWTKLLGASSNKCVLLGKKDHVEPVSAPLDRGSVIRFLFQLRPSSRIGRDSFIHLRLALNLKDEGASSNSGWWCIVWCFRVSGVLRIYDAPCHLVPSNLGMSSESNTGRAMCSVV